MSHLIFKQWIREKMRSFHLHHSKEKPSIIVRLNLLSSVHDGEFVQALNGKKSVLARDTISFLYKPLYYVASKLLSHSLIAESESKSTIKSKSKASRLSRWKVSWLSSREAKQADYRVEKRSRPTIESRSKASRLPSRKAGWLSSWKSKVG